MKSVNSFEHEITDLRVRLQEQEKKIAQLERLVDDFIQITRIPAAQPSSSDNTQSWRGPILQKSGWRFTGVWGRYFLFLIAACCIVGLIFLVISFSG